MNRSAFSFSRVLLGATVLLLSLGAFAMTLAPSRAVADDSKQEPPKKRLLIVTVTKGFRHGDSIPLIESIVKELGEKDGSFTVDYVRTDEEMAQKMTAAALQTYDGVLFGNTTGDLPLPDKEAFLEWIAEGHGFIGVHSATDTFHSFPPYIEMIGGEFLTHGPQVNVFCNVEDKTFPATRMLGGMRMVFDEIYQFKNYDRNKVHPLLGLTRHPNNGTPGYYPIAWCKMYEKGRVFYTALGHRPDVWKAPWYQLHVLGGIRWALGLEKGDASLPNPASK
jgi:uncharacterized protein